MPELVIATFNVHAGIDGWGSAFDVSAACAVLDADVLFLEENWIPESGQSLAREVGQRGGYEVHEAPLSPAMIFDPAKSSRRRWGPSRRDQHSARPLWVCEPEILSRVRRRRKDATARLGSWGIAVLSRLPMTRVETIELGRLPRDNSRRAALLAEIDVDGSPITAVGTHLAHFVQGSPILLNRLRRRLPAADQPAVLVVDMNFWGPPVSLALPGWRRAVRARTYPSWRAHSQIDHILVTRPVKVVFGESVQVGRSDHLPIRARLAIS